MHPLLSSNEGQARYQELLQEAEVERQYRQMRKNGPHLLSRLGDLLIISGQKLKGQLDSPPASTPALRAK